MDDAKVSHVEEEVVQGVTKVIEKEFGKMNPTYGQDHECLGMKIHFSDDKKVTTDMHDQIREIINDFPEEINGGATSPAAKRLMMVGDGQA